MKKITLTLPIFLLTLLGTFAQNSNFIGTFINATNSVSIQFKRVGDEYHGTLATVGASFAIRATGSGNRIRGEFYGLDGPVDFEANLKGLSMSVRATGFNEPFYKYSDQHNLGNFNLTNFMKDNSGASANEVFRLPTTPQTTQNFNGGFSELNNQSLSNIISGSQLAYSQRTSYVNDSMASSTTYVNFCNNGTFSINMDGSFNVESEYGDDAQEASNNTNSGTWQLVNYKGRPAVYLQYYNGQTSLTPFKEIDVRKGRWRLGNTQYALQRNKVRCN
ncbi:MAG: hypothetical protein GYB37_05315 [Algicola sp.]|nr:hypothetical protein [Algicola sp.]